MGSIREQGKSVRCPTCGAAPHKPCVGSKGRMRKANHRRRNGSAVGAGHVEAGKWAKLRYQALLRSDGKCECCGRSKHDGIVLCVDHIKPRLKHPELQWELGNLQVLCGDCNWGKFNDDETDWRKPVSF
jgi:5-methylcytosine-specific restriction endonuclease McrA